MTTVNRNCLAENSGTCFQMSSKLLDIFYFFSCYYSLDCDSDSRSSVRSTAKLYSHVYANILQETESEKYLNEKTPPSTNIQFFSRPSGIPEHENFLKF